MREIALEQIPNLWRADDLTAAAPQLVSSGFADLDRMLGGGWPVPGLLEVLCDQPGVGELQLLRPLMQALSALSLAAAVCKPVLWINPPYEPHAIALAQRGLDPRQHWCLQNLSAGDALWAAEQSLRSGACSMLLCWLHGLNMSSLRRLKLAALSGVCVGVLFRAKQVAAQPTPANLRLCLVAAAAGLQIEVLKVQGRRPGRVLLKFVPQSAETASQVMS
jgi:protein ImuA